MGRLANVRVHETTAVRVANTGDVSEKENYYRHPDT